MEVPPASGSYLTLLRGKIDGKVEDPDTGRILDRSELVSLYRELIFFPDLSDHKEMILLLDKVRSMIQIPWDIHDEMVEEAKRVLDRMPRGGTDRKNILAHAISLDLVRGDLATFYEKELHTYGLGDDYYQEVDLLELISLMERDEIENYDSSINSNSESGMKKYVSDSVLK